MPDALRITPAISAVASSVLLTILRGNGVNSACASSFLRIDKYRSKYVLSGSWNGPEVESMLEPGAVVHLELMMASPGCACLMHNE